MKGAAGETKKPNKPVQIGGPKIEVRFVMLASAPCKSPCSFAGTACDIRACTAG